MLRSELSKNLRRYLDPAIKSEFHKKYIERLLTDDSLFTNENVDQMHLRVRRGRRVQIQLRGSQEDSFGLWHATETNRGFEGKSIHLLVIALTILRSIPLIFYEHRN